MVLIVGRKVARAPGRKVPRLQGRQIARSPDRKVTRSQGRQFANSPVRQENVWRSHKQFNFCWDSEGEINEGEVSIVSECLSTFKNCKLSTHLKPATHDGTVLERCIAYRVNGGADDEKKRRYSCLLSILFCWAKNGSFRYGPTTVENCTIWLEQVIACPLQFRCHTLVVMSFYKGDRNSDSIW